VTTIPKYGEYAGMPCGITEFDNGNGLIYPLTPCCGASGKGGESSTGVICRNCYEEVDGLYGGCEAWPLSSEDAANHFIEQAAYTNNGGGIADESHLFIETDCPKMCGKVGEGEACPHGFASAYDTAKRLGWLDEQDNITDKWSEYHLAATQRERDRRAALDSKA